MCMAWHQSTALSSRITFGVAGPSCDGDDDDGVALALDIEYIVTARSDFMIFLKLCIGDEYLSLSCMNAAYM